MRLDPTVLELARRKNGYRNDEVLGVVLGRSSPTIRKWRKGKGIPGAIDLWKLKKLTGRPMDTMLIEDEQEPMKLSA